MSEIIQKLTSPNWGKELKKHNFWNTTLGRHKKSSVSRIKRFINKYIILADTDFKYLRENIIKTS